MPTLTLDVRPALARGESPLDGVLAAWAAVPVGASLAVIAPFEPTPMLAMFSAQGVAAACREAGPDEYHLLLGPKRAQT